MERVANVDAADNMLVDILNNISTSLDRYQKQPPGPKQLKHPNLVEITKLLKELSDAIPHPDTRAEWCKGVGNVPKPESFWLGFLPRGQKASNGIYTAICFERGGNKICVGCCTSGNGSPHVPLSIKKRHPQGLSSKGKIDINKKYYKSYFTNETEVFLRKQNGWTADDVLRIKESAIRCQDKTKEILLLMETDNKGNQDRGRSTDKDSSSPVHPLNQILYGPPGTGKTRNAVIHAVAIADGCDIKMAPVDEYNKVLKRFNELKDAKRIEFTTFHQSYGYEDFIEGIQPRLEGSDLKYELRDGVFKHFCDVARGDPNNNYIFIIDEINRGNIAKIFGELITLIEPSRRAGAGEEMTAVLPYSQKPFSVPNNVYVLGTMNTADRSIALLDTALRRRFSFVEMMPETEVLNDNVDGIDLKRLLGTINRRITFLLDREHQIGHSYFIGIRDIGDLAKVFKNDVIPLLQEYFFDNYENIRLVIGDFVRENKTDYTMQTLFGNTPLPLDIIDSEKKVYELNEEAFARKESYTSIYQVQK